MAAVNSGGDAFALPLSITGLAGMKIFEQQHWKIGSIISLSSGSTTKEKKAEPYV